MNTNGGWELMFFFFSFLYVKYYYYFNIFFFFFVAKQIKLKGMLFQNVYEDILVS